VDKRIFMGALGSALVAPWALAQPAQGVSDTEVVFGQPTDLTGALADIAPDVVAGVQVCFDAVNARGGVHGRRLRVVVADDNYQPAKTVAVVQKMLSEDRVFGLINPTGTANVAAVLPLLAKETPAVPVVGPFTGADVLRTPAIPNVFNIRASYGDEVEKLVQQLTTVGVQRIAVLWVNNGFGKDGLSGVQRSMDKRGLTLHAHASVEQDSSNVDQAVQKLSASAPDAIILITAGAPTLQFIRAYRKVSRLARFYTTSVMGNQATLRALGEDGVGVVVTSVVPFPWSVSTGISREYQTALKAAGQDERISFLGLESYINARVVVEALRRAGRELTRTRFMQAMESLQNFELGGFDIRFGPGVRQGSRYVDLTIIGKGERFTR
jgi:branched-chain amino acid transport system substrate-binding protein